MKLGDGDGDGGKRRDLKQGKTSLRSLREVVCLFLYFFLCADAYRFFKSPTMFMYVCVRV